MNNKYIFLDKDGVLNHHKFYHEYLSGRRKRDIYYEESIWKESLELINELIENTGAKIVLSASCRADFPDSKAASDYFQSLGLKGEIVSRTPWLSFCERGKEIDSWLKNIGYDYQYWNKSRTEESMVNSGLFSYVIIDDDADFLYTQRNHVVQVEQIKCKSGFNRHHLKRATKILNTSILDLDF